MTPIRALPSTGLVTHWVLHGIAATRLLGITSAQIQHDRLQHAQTRKTGRIAKTDPSFTSTAANKRHFGGHNRVEQHIGR